MRITVVGAGAIGTYLGVMLSRAGADVALVARGPHLKAMQAKGARLRMAGQELTARLTCTADPAELGPSDYVLLCLKAHSIPAMVDRIRPLLGPATAIVTAVNGIPYWYFHRHGGDLEGRTVDVVDPDGRQWRLLGPERAIGCVLYPAVEVVEPGVVEHHYGNRIPLGEPDGSSSDRIVRLAALFEEAGLRAPILDRIRDEIWLKLWGNVAFNPISALTHGTLEQIGTDEGTRAVVETIMDEAERVAGGMGIRLRVDKARRIDGAVKAGAHKTSMLIDLERGRPMEIDALVTVVQELADMIRIPTPTIDVVAALVKQRAANAGLYGNRH